MTKAEKPSAFDVTSLEPTLYYTGPGIVSGVPADDLSDNVLYRLTWLKKGQPKSVSESDLKALRDELVATGNYATSKESS